MKPKRTLSPLPTEPAVNKKLSGSMSTKAVGEDKNTGKTVEIDESKKVSALEPEQPAPVTAPRTTAMIRIGDSVKISRNFQSVGIEIAVEMPWPVRPGHVEDVKEGIDKVADFVDQEVTNRYSEVEGQLNEVVTQMEEYRKANKKPGQ